MTAPTKKIAPQSSAIQTRNSNALITIASRLSGNAMEGTIAKMAEMNGTAPKSLQPYPFASPANSIAATTSLASIKIGCAMGTAIAQMVSTNLQ